MSSLDCKALLEGLLFVADGPLSMDRLVSILHEFEKQELIAALDELRLECERNARGIVLAEVAGGYQFRTRPEHAEVMRRLQRSRPSKFSQSALESLAIIAYRQPVTRAEIEYLRGVDCGGVVKTLLERKLIRILGKKDVPGRPIVYGTTREFLETFNLKNLNALPTLREIQDLAELPVYEEQGELPLDPSLSAPFVQPLLAGEPES
ncbi:SMC-Scp complex subunit ScpB [Geobacter pelophilus]|uniref:SMC-Scp complex subunit ScpB n=1 Tax=Geoanaerobacter pelophilus TaxID=60036 RepID=A0AAW4L6Z8_9BACT|nr:SMC-Scp complex subunit ScpB [Geoanaerobacter pelophilus]MBT0664360.1 SMC-Scp complex subunit ScpB [Geoanaerobacter pelophilus]